MKNMIIVIIAVVATLIIIGQRETIKEIKNDNKVLRNRSEVAAKEKIQAVRVNLTDSLDSIYQSRPPITETKIKIKHKYDTIIDTILAMPTSEQLRYVTEELNRLYPDQQGSSAH